MARFSLSKLRSTLYSIGFQRRNALPILIFAAYALFARYNQKAEVRNLSGVAPTTVVKRPYGMGPWAFNSCERAFAKAGLKSQAYLQAIGYAKASAGTHEPDGIAHEVIKGKLQSDAYTCAIDIRSKYLNQKQIYALLSAMTDAGFAPWWRHTGSFARAQHIHAVFVGYPMKPILRAQVLDYLAGRTGMKGHAKESFYQPTAAQKRQLRALYERCSLGKKATPVAYKETD